MKPLNDLLAPQTRSWRLGIRPATVRTRVHRALKVLNVYGKLVTTGLIDLHSHGQTPEAYRYKAMDGVTTALELEVGVSPVPGWYAERTGHALINFGASSGHIL